ncbi:Ig-like domain-containing protein [Novipirellula rosea]|uniref:Ig-like domain-containing protein n=1 Tax=Novipirellula rosea TaxID=1031540 RepID=UPI0031E6779E
MSRRPRIESLEDRRLLAVVLQPTTGTVSANVVSGDQYFDSGNIGADYLDNENGVLTLNSGPGSVLQVDFTSFETEGFNLDLLRIFDGSDTTTPLIGTFQGASVFGNEDPPGTITGTNNELTFEFITDGSVVFSGWEANVNVFAQDLIIGGTGGDDDFTIGLNGAGQLEVTIGGAPANIAPYGVSPFDTTFLNSVTVVGGAGDDSLTVDLSNGPIPGLSFVGGTQATADGDSLTILGSFNDQILNYTTTTPGEGNNGNIDLDGAVITYTGLEPINAGNAANTTLNLPLAISNDATLQNSAATGFIEIIDNGATFENTVIPNPTNSLTVNLGNAGDLLNVTTLDADYAASLIVNGGFDFDTVQLNAVNLDTANSGRGLWVTETEILSVTGGMISNNTALIGGGILIDNATSIFGTSATLDGVTVTGNTATGGTAPTQGGGGVFNRGGGFLDVVNGSMITNNVATTGSGSGGGIFSSGILTVDSSTISGNSANRAGGGIEISGMSGTTSLTNVTLTNNQAVGAPGNGGGMHISGTVDTNILGGTVSGNSAALEGGGLWNGGGTMTIDGTTIDGNTASGDAADEGGGGIFNEGGFVQLGGLLPVSSITITNNVADGLAGSGGGILNNTNGVLISIGATISGNVANRAGGGIEDNSDVGGFVDLQNTQLNDNLALGTGSAPGNGGGLHVSGPGNVNILGGTVSGNSAAEEGGGLWNDGGTMTINGTTIDGNTASGDGSDQGGGGIFNDGGIVNVTGNALIIGNVANGLAGSGGGILNDVGGTLSVDNSALAFNLANRAGGGIEDNSGSGLGVTLLNVNLDLNSATGMTAPGNGGGLHVTGTGDVNIFGGTVIGNTAAEEGGGLWNGGGTMIIDRTLIDGNLASGDGSDQGGGGIFNNGGNVDIDNVTISGNLADGTLGSGGGIQNVGGSITINNSLIDGNTSTRAGGGIEDNAGTGIDITDSVIRNNDAGNNPGNGGGIHISGAGLVTIDGSTIHDNTAVEGGGLWNSGTGTFTLTNTTISGNTATGSDGGGIFNTDGGTVITDSVTVTLNDAATGIGSGIAGGTGGVTIENTIVAQNPGSGIEENLSGSINSNDFNLIGDADDGTLTGLTVNTIFGGNALLLPLLNNSGPTPTHLPGAGSPVIGFGVTTLTVDQRDFARPQGSQDDIGAVEVDLNGFVISADNLAFGNAGDGNPDEFLIINDGNGLTGDVQVFVNSVLVFSAPKATTGLILIRGSADDDTLVVDNSNGLVGAKIVFDGDGVGNTSGEFRAPGGFDVLRLIGTTSTNTTYNPGETADAGAVFQENNQLVQRVEFFGLEPIQVIAPAGGNNVLNVAAAPLGVGFPQALNAANSINYTQGPNSNDPVDPVFAGALTGLITVDGFESLEFANFEVLNIDAGAGSDEINLNNPVTPDELGVINVAGGDPTASDTVVVNGTAAQDTIVVDQLSTDGARITGAQPVPVVVTTTEHLIINGQGGDDALTYTSPGPGAEITFNPGVKVDSGTITADAFLGNPLLPVEFKSLDVGGSLAFVNSGGGRSDGLDIIGTDNDDLFSLTNTGRLQIQKTAFAVDITLPISTDGITFLRLIGRDGDDTFNMAGDHPIETGVEVQGGNPGSGSDVLNFTGSGGAVTLNLTTQTIDEAGALGSVSYAGVETVNIDANAALTIEGTADNDTFNVTPVNANNDGSFDHSGSNGIAFHYTDAATVTFNGGGGTVDQLNILGDADADTITSTAASVTVDTSEVTLGNGLEVISVLGIGGDDNIDLSTLGVAATIRGGDGNDTLVGTPQVDDIFGGAGNDTITGGLGNDNLFGDADSDTLIWNNGDGSDLIEGGTGTDSVTVNGAGVAANGDNFVVRANGSRVSFERTNLGLFTLDIGQVEQLNVNTGDSDGVVPDEVVVNSLLGTELAFVNVDGGPDSDNALIVNATDAAENITIGAIPSGVLGEAIFGLAALVTMTNFGGLSGDNLTINGLGGNDVIDGSANGLFNPARFIFNGGEGDDTLIGGFGDDTINGGDGDDVIDARGGDYTIDGGAGGDTILVSGTSAGETISTVHAGGAFTITGGLSAGANTIAGIEQVRIDAGDGPDIVNVTTDPAGGLDYNVFGGSPIGVLQGTGDTLNVILGGASFILQPGPEADSGAVLVQSNQSISFDEFELLQIDGIDLVLPDAFEPNDTLATAKVLGSEPAITVMRATLHATQMPSGGAAGVVNDDWYQVTAHDTGKLIINAHFTADGVPLDGDGGDVVINLFDSTGALIVAGAAVTGGQQIVVPVVAQQKYFVQVTSADGDQNTYDLEIENFAAPIPATPFLSSASDSGMLNNDNLTNDNTPTLVIQDDLADFAAMNIPIDLGTAVAGAEVILSFTSTTTGTVTTVEANLVNGANPTLWNATSTALADDVYLVQSWTRIQDAAGVVGRSPLSGAFLFTVDTTAPVVAAAPDLLSIADTGMFDNDDVTHIQAVALANPAGTTVEPNTKVRVFSGTELVGQGVATTEGNWEITTEPLDTGTHSLTVVLEDLAGNVNAASAALVINVDAVVPNTPYLDLINDDGHSTDDNITGQNLLQFEMVGNDTVNGNGNPLPNDVIYRLYWRVGDGNGEVLVYDSFAEFGFTTLGTLTRTVSQVLNDPTGTPFPDGVHNFKLEIEDRAGNVSPDFLLQVKIDTLVPTTTIDILASSDSGMYDDDNVTNIQEIAFQGRGETNGIITLFAQKVNSDGAVFSELLVIGTGNVGSDFTDVQAAIPGATDTDGLGIWEITAEPLTDGVYDVYALIEDWAGNEAVSETIRLEVDTLDPNLPLLDLDEASDSGRHNDDNITNDNTPAVSLTTHDANADLHAVVPDLTVAGAFLTDYLKYRVYDRAETGVVGNQTLVTETLLYDSAADATADASTSLLGRNAMFTSLLLLNSSNAQTILPALADGVHNLKIEVEDRAGNISHDFLLNLVIDTTAPAAPSISLDPAVTDSGIQSNIGSSSDRITNVRTPGFVGTAEADSLVRLYADGATITNNVIDGSDAAIGLAVAVPLDGDDAFPGGQYRATSTADLNVGFTFDGQRQIGGTAEDLAGNVSSPTFLNILLDTTPPTVTGVDYSAGNTVFASKPNLSPTPAVGSLLITFAGGPSAAAGLSSPAVDPGLAADVNNYKLVGDHSGQVLIDNAFIVSSTPEQVVVRIQFAALLADDRYTLTLDDSISDAAGNLLDGDSSAQAPGTPVAVLPSGNGISGGDFAARFTVDSRPEFGTISQGLVYVDINGNHVFDPEGQDNDATNRDFVMQFGQLTDALFAGNFADKDTGIASGFDKLGAYGRFNGTYSFLIDTNDDGVGDVASVMPGQYQVNGIPVAGDFSAAKDGDEIGLFDGQAWYLDTNGNNKIESNERITTNYNGLPIVGDFNGDGNDDLAVFVNDTNQFIFDTNRDGTADFTWDVRDDFKRFGGLSGFTDRPIVGDINLDGIDDIGIWVKGRQGILPKEQGEVFFWISDRADNDPANVFDAYSPAPLGNDTFAQYGDETALPIFGNFDPPIASANAPTNLTGLTNGENRYDVNNDGKVTALDALTVINAISRGLTNAEASQAPRLLAANNHYLDVDSNEVVTAFDALLVINEMNRLGQRGSSGQSEQSVQDNSSKNYSAAVDDVFSGSLLDDEEDTDWITADLESRRGVLS